MLLKDKIVVISDLGARPWVLYRRQAWQAAARAMKMAM